MLGYRPDLEDRDWLKANAADPAGMDGIQFAAPNEVLHHLWFPRVNQSADHDGSHVNSCVGHMLWAAAKVLNHNDGGDSGFNPSRLMCYVASQRYSNPNCFGRDEGAAISGARKAGEELGFVSEQALPYTRSYPREFPSDLAATAANKIKQHAYPRSNDDFYTWVGSRKGVQLIGVPWMSSMAGNQAGRVWTLETVRSGRLLGWHALLCAGYFENGDIEVLNWHGDLYARATPDVLAYWRSVPGAENILVSDIDEMRSRQFRRGLLAGLTPEKGSLS